MPGGLLAGEGYPGLIFIERPGESRAAHATRLEQDVRKKFRDVAGKQGAPIQAWLGRGPPPMIAVTRTSDSFSSEYRGDYRADYRENCLAPPRKRMSPYPTDQNPLHSKSGPYNCASHYDRIRFRRLHSANQLSVISLDK